MIKNDEYGLFSEGERIPYLPVRLTAEEAKSVEFKGMEFYSTNGRTLFPVRDASGKETGEWMLFVLFRSFAIKSSSDNHKLETNDKQLE